MDRFEETKGFMLGWVGGLVAGAVVTAAVFVNRLFS